MKCKCDIFQARKFIIIWHYRVNKDILEVGRHGVLFQRIKSTLSLYFARCCHVFKYLLEIEIDFWFNLESNVKIHSYQNSGNYLVNLVINSVRFVYPVNMNKPVCICPFGLFLEY